MVPHATESEIDIARYEDEGGRIRPMGVSKPSNFVYDGRIDHVSEFDTAEEHTFRKGDFYVIEPGVVYAQKSAPATEILFIKVPPGNDKVPVDTTPEVEAWFREPIKE
jgi:8-oxo-dGTP diphosphatase